MSQAAPADRRSVLLDLARRAWEFRARVIGAVLLLVAAKLAAVAVPLLLKRIVDALGRPEALAALPAALLVGYALTRFASSFFTEMRDLTFARVTQSTVAAFTRRIFAHLHGLPARFHLGRATGALTRDVERGTAAIAFLLGVGLFTIVPTVVEIAAVMAILLGGYDWQFGLVLMFTFATYVAYTVLFTRLRAAHQRAVNELDSNANRRLVDSLLNYETVKQYGNERFEERRFGEIMGRWIEAGVANQKALTRLHVGQSAIIAAGVAAVMVLAGDQVLAGTMTVGDLVLVNAYVIQVCLPLNSLGFVFREASDAVVKAERVFQLLAERPEVERDARLSKFQPGAGEVRFERVSFGYEPTRQVLLEVDFAIPAGHTVAVVGGSGSGKSTLARLLLRFYDVGSGRITVNGQDVRSLEPHSLRAAIGIVPQDTSLFNDTIAYNIRYGRVDATREEVVAAARAANVHDFIEGLPEGYDTVVGERGLKLSGGEKQRIAIARAILRNPPIMVFDEATSALDTRSERAIQVELERLSRSRTTLVIAHRLSTVVNADEILVLEHGRLVERGRHRDLLGRRGLYAQMWALQEQARELERAERRAALQPVDLAAVVGNALEALRGEIDARGVHFFATFGREPARVTGDAGDLQRLAWDLMAHAVQSSAPGGRVEVRLEREQGEVRLAVTHMNAPPLAAVPQEPAKRPRLPGTERHFEPGELRALVEEHHGRFTVEAAPPSGTTYAARIPLRAVDTHGPPQPPRSAPGETAIAGRRILVLDDHEDAREVLALVLEGKGAQVPVFATGGEALRYLRATPADAWPHLLVCDIGLPDIDGHEVLKEVRRMEAERGMPLERRVPAIALTGRAEPADRTRALLAGFQAHLAKPVDPNDLLATIASFLPPAASIPRSTAAR